MGKTIGVIVIILLSLACGAMGYEIMRQQVDKQTLETKVGELENKVALLGARKTPQHVPQGPGQDALDDLHSRMSAIEKQNRELLAANQELAVKLEKALASGKVGDSSSVPDITNLDDKQKEALRELVEEEADARDQHRANMIKSMVKQRFDKEFKKISEKLDMTPLQKDDAQKLLDGMIDKGFGAVVKAFESGDLEAAREELRRLVEEADIEIKKILDHDQIEKLKELDPDGFGRRETERMNPGR